MKLVLRKTLKQSFVRWRSVTSIMRHPVGVALGIAGLFSIRFLDCLPFSEFTRTFNYETVTTLTSFFIFAAEPFSFPLGDIKGLTFPFVDANVGNIGALPLFAISIKALGKVFPYFQTFDYFVLAEIISCFLTAFFTQKILIILGVHKVVFRMLGALLAGLSFLLLTRSAMLQPFCVVSFPIFTAWIYAMEVTLQRGKWEPWQDLAIVSIFPITALLDNYSLVGILLGTGVLLAREFFEDFFGGLASSWNRFYRILFFLVGGVTLSVLSLYIIGMFPLPSVPNTFSSYDFGMGGRDFGADLFGPWIPVGSKISSEPSLLSRFHFPIDTDDLGFGQYEGIAYIGTAAFLMWVMIAIGWVFSSCKTFQVYFHYRRSVKNKLALYSPWKKIGLAVFLVFLFSLGYKLHIFGHDFPSFSGMPAAWIADRIPSLYNIRAMGRLAPLLSLFLILEGVRRLYCWHVRTFDSSCCRSAWISWSAFCIVGAFIAIHLIEVAPLLQPVSAQALYPLGGVFSDKEVKEIRNIALNDDIILVAPGVRDRGTKWVTQTFALAYYSGLRSNLYYLARIDPKHDRRIRRDMNLVMQGNWDALETLYGNILFAIPSEYSDKLRAKVSGRYHETRIGDVSLWSKQRPVE